MKRSNLVENLQLYFQKNRKNCSTLFSTGVDEKVTNALNILLTPKTLKQKTRGPCHWWNYGKIMYCCPNCFFCFHDFKSQNFVFIYFRSPPGPPYPLHFYDRCIQKRYAYVLLLIVWDHLYKIFLLNKDLQYDQDGVFPLIHFCIIYLMFLPVNILLYISSMLKISPGILCSMEKFCKLNMNSLYTYSYKVKLNGHLHTTKEAHHFALDLLSMRIFVHQQYLVSQ